MGVITAIRTSGKMEVSKIQIKKIRMQVSSVTVYPAMLE